MDPVENFEHVLSLATPVWVAQALRCLDRAGLLDDEARTAIHAQLDLVSEAAGQIPQGSLADYGPLAHLDMLVRTLPPRR